MGLLEQIVTGITKEIKPEMTPINIEEAARTTRSSSRKMSGAMPRSAPEEESSQVVQVTTLPLTLKLADYIDAYSNSNPEGDMLAAQKFQQLVDIAPDFQHEYMTSASSIEDMYGGIINGASAPFGSNYVLGIIAEARRKFDNSSQAEFVGHDDWRIIEANPNDWYTDNASRYKKIKIPLGGDSQDSSGLGFLNDQSTLTKLTLGNNEVQLSAGTKLTHCELEYMLVRFIRPWMNFNLFQTSGWWLSGQPKGFCSTGHKNSNKGILPLITTGMILVRSAKFEGQWDPADQKLIDDYQSTNGDVYVGPYRLANGPNPVTTVSVAAWISELVPLSPKTTGPSTNIDNDMHFTNKSQSKTICVVKWKLNGVDDKSRSQVESGDSDKIEIPKGATEIIVIIRAKEGKEKKTVFKKKYAAPSSSKFTISGTFDNTKIMEA